MVPLPKNQPRLNVRKYKKWRDGPRDEVLCLHLSEDLKKRLNAAAKSNEVYMSDIANKAIGEWLGLHGY